MQGQGKGFTKDGEKENGAFLQMTTVRLRQDTTF
jgi:hypothetical protein